MFSVYMQPCRDFLSPTYAEYIKCDRRRYGTIENMHVSSPEFVFKPYTGKRLSLFIANAVHQVKESTH